jgi:hypothetical protein
LLDRAAKNHARGGTSPKGLNPFTVAGVGPAAGGVGAPLVGFARNLVNTARQIRSSIQPQATRVGYRADASASSSGILANA